MKLVKLLFFLTGLGIAVSSSPVYAAKYYFSQNLVDNGNVSGYFVGEDVDSNGKIISSDPSDQEEVGSFYLHYSGNSFLNSLNCNDCGSVLQNLEYHITDNTLKLLSYGYKNMANGYWGVDYVATDPNVSIPYLWLAFFPSGDVLPSEIRRLDAISPLVVSQTPISFETPLPGALFLFMSVFSLLPLFQKKRTVRA